MKIVFSGGGTLGSLAPLMAIHSELKGDHDYRGIWIGLGGEREQTFIGDRGFQEYIIPSPRFRNTESDGFSLATLTFPWRFLRAFSSAYIILRRERPDAHCTAGSFVSVPVALAAYFLRIPTLVHQQDLIPGLANRLMAKFAFWRTVAFPELVAQFPGAEVVGNPVRSEISGGQAESARSQFRLDPNVPTVLIIGGSSGAEGLNALVESALPFLTRHCQILQMTGKGSAPIYEYRYVRVPFFGPELKDVYATADLLIARAGLSTMTEAGVLGIPTVLVPIPDSHQEENARYFENRGVAVALTQSLPPETFANTILEILNNSEKRRALSDRAKAFFPSNAASRLAIILKSGT